MKKFYVSLKISEKMSCFFEIKTNPDTVRDGYGLKTSRECVENIIDHSLKIFNYSIDIGASDSDEMLILGCFNTEAETKSLTKLKPVIEAIRNGAKSYGFKVGALKLEQASKTKGSMIYELDEYN